MLRSYRSQISFSRWPVLRVTIVFANFLMFTSSLIGQSVSSALESPAAQSPQTGAHGGKLTGMPKFHLPAP